ncbi:PQQ-binding-like beta-propeller repeat protein [Promicromonospora iranensis]|uniref:Outer membrane protein assembly factor BamB n=1 Tax=Promicromonospora iranensis TaxID=1105144 RepID=A0ABU2CPE3_9MICO|nr:PQQ-binding-like beta-propeller repeat protein [Promicromonospora iranensis]MDR7383146.1 outer membrane protein assembly factor BamB [Promicromonospora iranensis]
MARGPDEGDAFVFDLVDDDVAARDAPTSPDGAGAPAGPAPSPGRKRRAAAQVAAVLAIVLGTGLAVDDARDHARSERMRDLPRGVTDVSSPLAETWVWGGAVGRGESTTDVAVLGGVLVLESDGELVALDPASGEEAWSVPLGRNADCGPMVSSVRTGPGSAALVCLQGHGAEREAIAVRPGGETSAPRALDAADARRYGQPHVGPDGTVLRAKRVGLLSAIDVGDAGCTDVGECTGTVEAGRDLVLRAEDAATGAERWTATVPFRPADATQCSRTFGGSWGGSANRLVLSGQLAPDTFGARVGVGLVDLQGCGVQASVTPDGVVLGTELEPGGGGVTRLGAAGYAATSFEGVARATLYAADGRVVGEVTGYPLGPWTTDEAGPATLLAVDEPARRLRAYEPDGTPRWDIALQSGGQQFLAQVGDTAVVSTGAGSVRGLDLATGAERWVWDGSAPASADDGGYFGSAQVAQAFTDGESVLLLTEGEAGGTRGLVALDAASGAVVWDRAGGGPLTTLDPTAGDTVEQGVVGDLVAVDGNLLEVTPRGVRGLG